MNTLLDKLTETIDRLSIIYDELLETAKTKQCCLISGNIEELEMLLYQEKNQTEIAQLLEEKRQNIINSYCKENHAQRKNVTMRSLMNNMDNLHRERVGSLLNKLTLSMKQLQQVNQTNTTLTHYSLDITEDIIKIFCPSAFQYSVYHHTGKIQEHEMPMVLIDTEI
ncbi:MAG: flagellar protein FlgN [Candidatus Brocadia sp. AMX2]|uniref:Flagella synthesis protein n=1 Tax=Candidatus Brocadia sinica JPN1 TaxID=1197129 RepID=A0ABQ0K204_9BACT|nr:MULTISPECIES: flagellar export chaperone FlgN [Brocadia]KXK27718.1 MAG: flagella synthesis protein FlgN [Candidatus Brocadia sinica]MBC6932112.1 flagellar protein FlgN [Candidatus Brocadia sp.]MBL1168803.1 flagellar protein FlgN [Candidatus Brocadia sp. AMX1]NOG42864.1 flagellar protein FlgN [Planctomycetota bacterium]KAA0244502.1 MAG: flagellar protein FlgN [Candidatus Brocadia sp. AMX2]